MVTSLQVSTMLTTTRLDQLWRSPGVFAATAVVSQIFNALTVVSMPDATAPRAKWIAAAVGLFALTLFSGARAFYLERAAHNECKRAAEPRLRLVFGKGQMFDSVYEHGGRRTFRVAVVNSGASVSNVAVKVARVHPELPDLLMMQELRQTTAEEGVSRFTVNKSAEPIVFVTVIHQRFYGQDGTARGSVNGVEWARSYKKGQTSQLEFAFASGERDLRRGVHPAEHYNEQYLIWLAIDGAGAEAWRKFVLRQNKQGQYDFEEAFA
jgi:hypothetical protein